MWLWGKSNCHIWTNQNNNDSRKIFKDLEKIYGFEHNHTTVDHPQSNGTVERKCKKFHKNRDSIVWLIEKHNKHSKIPYNLNNRNKNINQSSFIK
jgi:hypothetical protein